MRVDRNDYSDKPDVNSIIRVHRHRSLTHHTCEETCYYMIDLTESAMSNGQRIRGHWGVENKVHYVRDVTFAEDHSRVRTGFLPHLLAIARNLTTNLYRQAGFTNMAQAQRLCSYGLKHILELFRMK